MGSLMGGWSSPVLDPKSVKLKRNRSLTKQEIEAYWRSKRKLEEDHLRAVSMPLDRFVDSDTTGKDFKRSVSFPPATRTAAEEEELFQHSDDVETKNLNKSCWWTRSNWAFLNEPPVLDGAAKAYASRYAVADVASYNFNHSDGVGAWLHSK